MFMPTHIFLDFMRENRRNYHAESHTLSPNEGFPVQKRSCPDHRYNDQSPLENRHGSQALQLMRQAAGDQGLTAGWNAAEVEALLRAELKRVGQCYHRYSRR